MSPPRVYGVNCKLNSKSGGAGGTLVIVIGGGGIRGREAGGRSGWSEVGKSKSKSWVGLGWLILFPGVLCGAVRCCAVASGAAAGLAGGASGRGSMWHDISVLGFGFGFGIVLVLVLVLVLAAVAVLDLPKIESHCAINPGCRIIALLGGGWWYSTSMQLHRREVRIAIQRVDK